jgi:hypothetical protein
VARVPAGWAWASRDRLDDSYRPLIGLAAKAHDLGVQGKLELDRDSMTRQLQNTSFSHHALVVEVTASVDGWFRSAARIELTVWAELVYGGPEASRPTLGAPAVAGPR